jgi:hypothetical protein
VLGAWVDKKTLLMWVHRMFLILLATSFDATNHFSLFLSLSLWALSGASLSLYIKDMFYKDSGERYNLTNFTLPASENFDILFPQTTYNNTSLDRYMRATIQRTG